MTTATQANKTSQADFVRDHTGKAVWEEPTFTAYQAIDWDGQYGILIDDNGYITGTLVNANDPEGDYESVDLYELDDVIALRRADAPFGGDYTRHVPALWIDARDDAKAWAKLPDRLEGVLFVNHDSAEFVSDPLGSSDIHLSENMFDRQPVFKLQFGCEGDIAQADMHGIDIMNRGEAFTKTPLPWIAELLKSWGCDAGFQAWQKVSIEHPEYQ